MPLTTASLWALLLWGWWTDFNVSPPRWLPGTLGAAAGVNLTVLLPMLLLDLRRRVVLWPFWRTYGMLLRVVGVAMLAAASALWLTNLPFDLAVSAGWEPYLDDAGFANGRFVPPTPKPLTRVWNVVAPLASAAYALLSLAWLAAVIVGLVGVRRARQLHATTAAVVAALTPPPPGVGTAASGGTDASPPGPASPT